MIATRDIAAGEELVNNYGELSQAELLRGYGYVEHSNGLAHLHANAQVRTPVCTTMLLMPFKL
jgi:hypothetical protein